MYRVSIINGIKINSIFIEVQSVSVITSEHDTDERVNVMKSHQTQYVESMLI